MNGPGKPRASSGVGSQVGPSAVLPGDYLTTTAGRVTVLHSGVILVPYPEGTTRGPRRLLPAATRLRVVAEILAGPLVPLAGAR